MSKWGFAKAATGAALCLSLPGTAIACGNPSEQWYRDVSDVIFDGVANCKPKEESCWIRVTRVVKNDLALGIERRTIEIDYYSWYEEQAKEYPNVIILACGVPHFKPEEERFSARFYANLNEETSELVVRRFLTKGKQSD